MSDFVFDFQGAAGFAAPMPSETRAPSFEMATLTALGLSSVDLKLLHCASNGMVDKLIAKQLHLSAQRVHARWRHIRRALGANDRSHAVAIALSLELIAPPNGARVLAQRLNWK